LFILQQLELNQNHDFGLKWNQNRSKTEICSCKL